MKPTINYPYNAINDLLGTSPVPYSPEEDIRGKELTQDQLKGFEDALSLCTENEQKVFRFRYKEGMSLREIAYELHLTPERIRQIIAKTLRKLRRPSCFKRVLFGREGFAEMERLKEEKKRENNLLWEKSEKAKQCCVYFSFRTYNSLKRAGKITVADLLAISENDLKKIYGLGVKAIAEIYSKLDEFKKKSGEDWKEFSTVPFLPSVSVTPESASLKKEKKKGVILIKSGEDSISTWFFNSYEEGKKEMDKQYASFDYVELEEDWAEMSYCGNYDAILYCNGYGVYIWKIVEIQD